jgi:glutathione S-transferase
MTYKLYGSFTSPYVRKLRLLLWEDKTVEFIPLNYLEEAGNKLLKSINPLNQIPFMLVGDQPIFDSRVIYNHIAKEKEYTPFSIDEENILSAIDTAMASGVSLFSMRKGGIDISGHENYYIERQKERIPAILDYLATWTSKQQFPSDWNYLTMSLLSLLYWLELREIYNCKIDQRHPEMITFLKRFNEAPGVFETLPPA